MPPSAPLVDEALLVSRRSGATLHPTQARHSSPRAHRPCAGVPEVLVQLRRLLWSRGGFALEGIFRVSPARSALTVSRALADADLVERIDDLECAKGPRPPSLDRAAHPRPWTSQPPPDIAAPPSSLDIAARPPWTVQPSLDSAQRSPNKDSAAWTAQPSIRGQRTAQPKQRQRSLDSAARPPWTAQPARPIRTPSSRSPHGSTRSPGRRTTSTALPPFSDRRRSSSSSGFASCRGASATSPRG